MTNRLKMKIYSLVVEVDVVVVVLVVEVLEAKLALVSYLCHHELSSNNSILLVDVVLVEVVLVVEVEANKTDNHKSVEDEDLLTC